MRHVLLTLFVAFAVAASGLASASAFACPMAVEAAAAAHDCCPDEGGGGKNEPLEQHDMDACMMGMACRIAPAVTPTLAPIAQPVSALLLDAPVMDAPPSTAGPLEELFRPPRSI